MFTVQIELLQNEEHTGCNALDFRRSMGLPEAARALVRRREDGAVDGRSRQVTVDEAFAREYFHPTTVDAYQEITVSMLRSGELVVSGLCGEGHILLSRELSDDRIKELFLLGQAAENNGELEALRTAARRARSAATAAKMAAEAAAECDDDDD